MSLQQIYASSQNETFRENVRAAVFKAANAIAGEDPALTGFSVSKTQKRHDLAQKIYKDDGKTFSAFYSAVAADVGETDTPELLIDSTIQTSVESVWDDIAGVMYGE